MSPRPLIDSYVPTISLDNNQQYPTASSCGSEWELTTSNKSKALAPKDQIHQLQALVSSLETQLTSLKAENEFSDNEDSCALTNWRQLARQEAAGKIRAIQENQNLRQAIEENAELMKSLSVFLKKFKSQTPLVYTIEDTQWKLNILARDPSLRKRNAALIMGRMRQEVPCRAIRSGLIDVEDTAQYFKYENLHLLDRPAQIEENSCLRVPGNYILVADRLWHHGAFGQAAMMDGTTLKSQIAEVFNEDLCFQVAHLFIPMIGTMRPTTTRLLYHRIIEEGSITLLWKSVDEEAVESSFTLSNGCDGWLCVEKGETDENGEEFCTIKCSLWISFPPLGARLEMMIGILQQIGLYRPTQIPHTKKQIEREVRQAFANYFTTLLCKISGHLHQSAIETGRAFG